MRKHKTAQGLGSGAPNELRAGRGNAPNEFGATQRQNPLKWVGGSGRWVGFCLGIAAAAVLAACGATTADAGSCTLGLAAGISDEEAIAAVLRAEGQLVVDQQIEPLMALWADGSSITDAKNSPDAADDQHWQDKDAIRHRYVRTVFPGAPAQATPADLQTAVSGEEATVMATTKIGSEVSPAGDRWTLLKRNGCWLLESLTYNLEPQP